MIERQVLRGFLANVDVIPPLIVTFQFNPETVRDNKAVNYSDRNSNLCGNAPGKVYTGGGQAAFIYVSQSRCLGDSGDDGRRKTGYGTTYLFVRVWDQNIGVCCH